MQLGIAGLVVAALVVVVGLATVFMSASAPRTRGLGMSSNHFVFIPFIIIVIFAGLVTAAVALRRYPSLHKRLMTLAMIAILPPAIARLIGLAGMGPYLLELQTTATAIFVAVCLAGDWIKSRIVHPVYAIGGILLVLSWPFRVWVARTEEWGRVGSWMAEVGKSFIS